MPTLPDLERGGGHRKGEEEGPDPTPPQAGPMAVTAPLPVKKGYGKCGMVQSSILLLSLLWDLLSGGTPKVSFLRWGWCPVAACHALGTLLHCHGTRGGAMVAVTPRTRRLVSPNCRATMVAEDPCQKPYLASPRYMGGATTTSRTADEQCHREKAN